MSRKRRGQRRTHVHLEELPTRERVHRYDQIARILRAQGYDPTRCDVTGYEDEYGVTWWTQISDGTGSSEETNYIHPDGRSEFYGADEDAPDD